VLLPVLLDLWAGLRAAHHLYHTLHWQAKGAPFYGDHLMFKRLYESVEDEIDGLAEVIAGHYGADKLDPIKAWAAAGEKISRVATTGGSPLVIAEMLMELSESANDAIVNGAECPYPGALSNFVSGIGTKHLTDVYLLKQRYGSGAPKM
jgi:DNA-binding ferritin-like protein